MTQQNDALDRVRIASPCSVGWERMEGDERVRFCELCGLNVYNLSAMTREEATSLVARTEGRLCARLYRRADGTVLTSDCPVGLRAFRKRVAKMAGAALAAVLALFSGAAAQSKSEQDKNCKQIVALKIKKTVIKSERATFAGVVMDATGAVVARGEVTITNEDTKKSVTATTTDEGAFGFSDLRAGKYTLEIFAPGFKPYKQKQLVLNPNEASQAEVTLVTLQPDVVVLVGAVAYEPEIEYSNGTLKLSRELIDRLPH